MLEHWSDRNRHTRWSYGPIESNTDIHADNKRMNEKGQ